MDGQNSAPPRNPWNDDSPANTNNHWFVSHGFEMVQDFVHQKVSLEQGDSLNYPERERVVRLSHAAMQGMKVASEPESEGALAEKTHDLPGGGAQWCPRHVQMVHLHVGRSIFESPVSNNLFWAVKGKHSLWAILFGGKPM